MQALAGDAGQWAQQEFGDVDWGDRRRDRRLVRVAERLAGESHGTLPQSFGDWAELKAAYRLLESPEVSYSRIAAPHWQRTRQLCRAAGEYLLIEDTTELNYTSHGHAQGLGPIGDGKARGMLLHSTLALQNHGWTRTQEPRVTVVGLYGQQCWTRTGTGARRDKKAVRLSRERESQRWAAVLADTGGPPEGARWTYIADRESDIYEVFDRCDAAGVDFIIRAAQPRALSDEDGSAFQAVGEAPVVGGYTTWIRARPEQRTRPRRKGQKGKVTRPKQPGRMVKFEVRACRVQLRGPWRPQSRLANREINIVQALEVDPPEGAEPIRWVLLTEHPADDLASCMRVINRYACRWLIEEYHKALKIGVGIEQSQLESASRIQSLLGILSVVAVRLLGMKLLARVEPQGCPGPDDIDPAALSVLKARFGQPTSGWTWESVLTAIARLGGFLARKGDGSPGWITIWRGFRKLRYMTEGAELFRGEKCG